MTPQELKNSILQLAIQGKLVEQRPEEGTAEELFARIQKEKQRLIKEGKIKKEKSLPEITEDEKPFEIPESWKWVRVGNCGSWGAGATPSRTNSEYYGGTIPWLKTGDLNDGVIVEIPEYITELALGKRFVKGVLPFSNELRHKQYHIFIMLFDHNQSGTDCGLYFGNDIFPLNKGINRRCVFRQYLP